MANTNYLNRPNTVEVFASTAMDSRYLPVKFGTNRLASDIASIANENFKFGLESLEGDLQSRDLNSVLKYLSSNLAYLFQQGIPEYSPYQNYPANAVVQFDGGIWVATKEIKASKHEFVKDPCNPCKVPDCEVAENPSKENGWCKVVTHCTYDKDLADLISKDKALEEAIKNLKGVINFSIVTDTNTNTKKLVLALSDGSTKEIPMSKFGLITKQDDGSYKVVNADGSELTIPAHKASVKVVNKNGEFTFGYLHTEAEKVGESTSTIHLVESSDLDYTKGFTYNSLSKKIEVDLSDLIKTGSGLATDKEGNIYVVPKDIIDNSTLTIDSNGNIQINPEYTKARDKVATDAADKAKADANTYTDGKVKDLNNNIKALADDIRTNGATVFANKPITGNGTKSNPLTLNLGEGLDIDASGKLLVTGVVPKNMSGDINSGYKLGLNIFSGVMGDSIHNPENYMKGLPLNIWSEDKEQNASSNISDVTTEPSNFYDWSAIAVATNNQVMFQLTGVDNTVWQITNDSGIDSNGNVKDVNAWGKWQKLDNSSSITDTMVKNLQDLFNSLNARIQALENKNNETCKVPLKHVSADYTIVDTDNTLICINENPITITIPNNIPQGRLFTVVQTKNASITFKAQNGVTLFAPREGSLVMGGKDAVVSILVEIGNFIRIFGDTVSA